MTSLLPLLGPDTLTLAPFVEALVLDASAVKVAGAIARCVGGIAPEVLLGAALAARAPVFGHICVELDRAARSIVREDLTPARLESLPWPEPARWVELLAVSPAVQHGGATPSEQIRPLVLEGRRLYLERYWRYETSLAADLGARAGVASTIFGDLAASSAELEAVLDGLFGAEDRSAPDRQRAAARRGLTHRLAVIAGGPGTGKTWTIARLLAAAYQLSLRDRRPLEIALAAPTGKAAAAMGEAISAEASTPGLDGEVACRLRATESTTLHRLLGLHANTRPRHNRANPLSCDLLVVDETSMVSLPLMAHLLAALRSDAGLVLVGDPAQLMSVEAGAVLGEIVGPLADSPGTSHRSARRAGGGLPDDIVVLDSAHRFSSRSPIAALADAIRSGDGDRAVSLLSSETEKELAWFEPDDALSRLGGEIAATAAQVVAAAASGDAATALVLATEIKVLCATRHGSGGLEQWNSAIEALIPHAVPEPAYGRGFYVGQPVIITANDYRNRLFNGDVGIIVATNSGPVVAFPGPEGIRTLSPSQLRAVETWWVMTIHRSQGSEFRRAIVTLPPPPSPILTRELLYTAVTRAKEQVTLVATESSLRSAIDRPLLRASGLRERLWR